MLEALSPADRRLLFQFLCAFAWTDREVAESERSFVRTLAGAVKVDERERAEIEAWLAAPPDAESIDPESVPREHRRLFLDTCRELIGADGKITDDERDQLEALSKLLLG